jgi:hypothetical protein
MSPVAEYKKTTLSPSNIRFHGKVPPSAVTSLTSAFKLALIDNLLRDIREKIEDDSQFEDAEPRPTNETVNRILGAIIASSVSISTIKSASISTFYGEIDLTWQNGAKQLTLLCGGSAGNSPILHFYDRSETPTKHGLVPDFSENALLHWIKWLNAE